MRKIVVSCMCQTYGLAQALADFLPGDQVLARHQPQPGSVEEAQVLADVLSADLWVHADAQAFAVRHGLAEALGERACAVPFIFFDAFHPDLAYVAQDAEGAILPGYHSAIITWAWQRGVAEAAVPGLFTPENFEALGYFDRWAGSVHHLAQRFEAAGWHDAFLPYLLRVQRTGAFMHSVDHARGHALVELARLVAGRLGATSQALQADVVVNDVLVGYDWPLYPPVADALGLAGGHYQWHVDGQRICGLPDYVAASYQRCATDLWRRSPLRIGMFDMARFDQVLAPQVVRA